MTVSSESQAASLWKTVGGERAHLAQCGHLFGKDVVPAAGEQVCDLCQREVDGFGRTSFVDLDAALPVMGVSSTDWPAVLRALTAVEHHDVYLPYSRSYIALNPDGHGVAWVGKNYVDVLGSGRTELPGYASAGRGGAVTSRGTATCATAAS